ncbi:Ribosomal protein S18 acetylase RimI [Asanoa hainanensis]|uniref:Ribosomal protein S18 acetylase RimI n=1 Tax=Asanoa hainanensis TaxID=560556 RepID=A0A239K2G1_9ACTN|nr:GNAT family N-acetyltransferase [Asanoa hainanensis]SNT12576.1 Ribosomal protein S18 acetylase RimI [Asanoa hainanensis]
MVDLRVLSDDDWKLWRDLRLAALAEAPYAFGSTLADWQDAPEPRWRDRLRLPGARDLVAYLGDEPVGMATGVPTDPTTVELISVWVSPAGRGRGVGDALVEALASWATESGVPSLKLAVRTDNAAARRLYERTGFRDAGPNPEDPAEILMERSLPGAL